MRRTEPRRGKPAPGWHQERVNAYQRCVNGGNRAVDRVCTEGVTENLIAGLIAVGLIVYLVYALIRPDKF
ncbi:MAG: K(+)-transporting ATPase subunit F [Oryzihumus sp.]